MRGYAVLLLLASTAAVAVSVDDCTVYRADGRWHATLDARIAAPPASVYRAITDYNALHTLNPSILESRIIGAPVAGSRRVEMTVRVCILVFCKDVRRVQDVVHVDAGTVQARMVPGLGDFSAGTATWQVQADGNGTRLAYRENFVPDFWVPPVIGPWLIKRKLVEEVTVTGRYLEGLPGAS